MSTLTTPMPPSPSAPPSPKPPTSAEALANAEKQVTELTRTLARTREELSAAYLTRDTLGEALRRALRSPQWRWGRLGFFWSRLTGRLRVTSEKLVPMTTFGAYHRDGAGWAGTGMPLFLVPVTPIVGWARLRATIHSSVASRAVVYFDTGSGFHQEEHLVLGRVAGETVIDRMVPLRRPTYLIRFDAVQAGCEWRVEQFSLEPMSMLAFNAMAVLGNARKMIFGGGSHRPSILLGLKILFTGDFKKFHGQLVSNVESTTAYTNYDLWRKRHALTDADRDRMRAKAAEWGDAAPLISVILPVYNVAEPYLRACIESVVRQTYPKWELCIADDASPAPHVRRVIAEYAAAEPDRIKVAYRSRNGNIAAASNSALELATGSYVAMLDHDDEYAEHALFAVAEAIVADPSIDMVYSDEDKLSPTGGHVDPFFKPDWSPEYFLACMYTCHLSVYRAERVRELGGWRSAFDSCQDYDLALRVVAGGPKVHHIPDVLYHWRVIPGSTAGGADAKPESHLRARAAIENYLDLTGQPGTVEDGPGHGHHRVRYTIKGDPLVSLVIPSASRPVEVRGRPTWFVLECVSSIRRLSTYKNLEIVVIDNHDMSDDLAERLEPLNVRRLHYTDPGTGRFNLARKLNEGAFAARGDHLVLLNDDVEVITPDWIECLLEFGQLGGVGGVGPQLLFPNDTQQHVGVNLLEGNPGHPFYQFPGDHPGYFNSSVVHRNWSAVTGACLMTPAKVYRELGGFSEAFPLNYNDVDYCLRLQERGLRVVYTPYAKLYHHESVSKTGTDVAELEAFKRVWAERVPLDPYYNPNLTMQGCDFRIG
jgi:GT2 family glycosyltransferase